MLVRIATLFLTITLQAWSLDVDADADEAPSLLQGAFETLASFSAPVVDAEEKAEKEFQKRDNVVENFVQSHHLDNLHSDDSHENFDETEPSMEEGKKEDEDLEEMQSDSENSSYDGLDEDIYDASLKPQGLDAMPGENTTHELDSLSDSFSQLQHHHNLQQESKQESDEGLDENELGALKPETGDEMPSFPRSFPGCGCTYAEWSKTWNCKGVIAHPESMQGTDCCCCTLACDRKNRCTDDQCMLIGIDQKAEVAAEEARLAALRKDADALLLDLPVYKVSLGIGRPTGAKIEKACKDKKMVPLCDSYPYRNYGCYHPGRGNGVKPWKNMHFSVATQMLTLGLDPRQFYGLAFYQNRGGPYGGALTLHTMSHQWVQLVSTITIYDMGTKQAIQSIPVSQVDQGKALGGWHTYCVKEQSKL